MNYISFETLYCNLTAIYDTQFLLFPIYGCENANNAQNQVNNNGNTLMKECA